MNALSLTLEIVTPERKVFSEAVEHVVLPTEESGEIDVLPGHIPLMTMIAPGQLKYFQDGRAESIAIDRGFTEVVGNSVIVLTEAAVEVDLIDPQAAEKAFARAAEALEEARKRGDDPEVLEQLETKAQFALVQKIARDNRGR
jgi:F-type H+-transporting ATPase subunit epsilon